MKLDSNMTAIIKKKLEEERKRIKSNIASLRTQDPFSDPDRLNDNAASDTEANEETSHDRVEAIEKELASALIAVDSALERIDSGSYGLCQNCGKPIEEDRLAVKPTALYCLNCEKKLERK